MSLPLYSFVFLDDFPLVTTVDSSFAVPKITIRTCGKRITNSRNSRRDFVETETTTMKDSKVKSRPCEKISSRTKKEKILVGEAVVTVSCFAPVPGLFAGRGIEEVEGEVILTADFAGNIKVFSTLHSLS